MAMGDGMDGMMMDVPGWLTALAWAFVALSVACAALLARDLRRRGGGVQATDVVWVVGALAVGPLALWLWRRRDGVAADGLPGGAASAVAHVLGVPLVVASGLTIAGLDLWAMIAVIAVLAIALLFAFERLARRRATGAALLAAVVTVAAFDVGMGAWMVGLHLAGAMPEASHVAFVFLMQVGIVLGFLTGLPAVAWLRARAATA